MSNQLTLSRPNIKNLQRGDGPSLGAAFSVFISSSFLDNEERRKLVEDAILRAGMHPVGMERFTASANPTVEECQRQARECDVYLGIIAHRYGWIPDGYLVSITELEYDAAKEAQRPRLMFEIASSVPVYPEKDFDQGHGRGAKQDKLDAFKARYAADQMPTRFVENKLSGMVVQALHDWLKQQQGGNTATETSKPENVGLEPEIKHYREVVEIQHKEIPLAGFKTRLRVPIALEELYVPLQAMLDLRGTGDAQFADAADAEFKLGGQGATEIALIDAFHEALARKRRNLVILGDPGSGKTTHLKRLVLACLRQGPDGLGLPDDILPVFLPLRELEDLHQGIDAFIEKTLDSPHLNMPQGFGKRLLERGRLLLLFDGLDEVSDPKQRAKVARWIEGAVKARPDCISVVTCRFAGYDEASRLDADFLELHLRPMTQEQSESFIRNWYKAVETGLDPTPSGAIKAAEKAAELIERLREPDARSTRMAEMTRNPLLLANLCLVHRDRGGILPKGRHELYDECVAVLLELWRQNKSIGQGKGLSVSIPAQTGRRALQPAALWLHGVESRTRANAEELIPVLEPALKAAQWRDGDAKQFLQTLRDESGLLTGWSHGTYGFMHLGFQEYLAACELRRLALAEALDGGKRDTLATLAGHYGESWWNEVILLLLAQGNPSLFAPFMTEALKQARFAEDSAFLDLILEETAEFSAVPFVELLRQTPDTPNQEWVGAGSEPAFARDEVNRHSGRDRRNPDSMDGSDLGHPSSLDSDGPSQNDEDNTVELSTLTYQIVGRQPFAAETNRVPSRHRDADLPLNSTVLGGRSVSTAVEGDGLDSTSTESNANPVLWANQAAALRVLQRLAPDEIKPLINSGHIAAKLVATLQPISGVLAATERRDIASITGRVVASPTSLITQNCGVELILIPGGRFMMGSPVGEGRDDEHPAHEVDIRQFYLGRYPVTNEEYARYLEANPNEKQPAYWADRRFNQARQPVVGVDWEEASRFAQWAGGRLPTEAEWEYAVRAGTTSRYFWGKSDTDADEYAWHYAHSQNTTHPVGVKRPNAIGLHDMVGNVWEWQQDRWHDNYHDAPGDGSAWEDGKGSRRVIRGGPWVFEPGYLRSATRGRDDTDSRSSLLGFRLAQDL